MGESPSAQRQKGQETAYHSRPRETWDEKENILKKSMMAAMTVLRQEKLIR
jgi:hypothetical protein